ncbi:predicted protein [Nematostella vectensis]|uniref:Biogenesis of lysosome-related organelles complex 1 subunit 6 n=1 Tax=Nematostella vectensis TaxID=45351 RepID=A7RPL4_NEMVE|nr:biogenesis of lysosome-related organelles complex 1 subunit 6 [Nematostella vectensis]EDO46593.1 predicted protein [Nematostella vectensis]|eukprot:XP_001638656.1 predicted protein [Nematostella vectensis]
MASLGTTVEPVAQNMTEQVASEEPEEQKEGASLESLEAAIEILSTEVLAAFLPEMDEAKEKINELTQNQGILIETMQQENAKFAESQEAKALAEILSQVRAYHIKLNKIKHEMSSINERVARLKRRAQKLKSQKEKEEKSKLEAQQRELELERELTAKIATEPK